jgi:hypothetical protein
MRLSDTASQESGLSPSSGTVCSGKLFHGMSFCSLNTLSYPIIHVFHRAKQHIIKTIAPPGLHNRRGTWTKGPVLGEGTIPSTAMAGLKVQYRCIGTCDIH